MRASCPIRSVRRWRLWYLGRRTRCLLRRAVVASGHSSRGTEPSGLYGRGGPLMRRPLGIALAVLIVWLALVALPPGVAAKPEGTLTVAVATFGNERWLPHLYVGAEDVVL